MVCNFSCLRNKEVVDIRTGEKIGFADDVELDTDEGKIISLIIYGRPRVMGLMGRDDDVVIKCSDIRLIGEDTILVETADLARSSKEPRYVVDNLLKTSR
ncbi:MAG: YlmC/YmxH family sporulation protein [Ruminococcus sp.]|jgi:sporulation protein, YlmC/YmxH family|nr:YlmC/YmxH family sporulation protein [Ruminococcus sp.]MBP3797878.1 YlmC/YmxH family sporulation protein [Ruminococcus sp.]MBQ1434171.1 YlmC/YmxH family sporulation protein [Ruminococcus sp.]